MPSISSWSTTTMLSVRTDHALVTNVSVPVQSRFTTTDPVEVLSGSSFSRQSQKLGIADI